MPSSFVVASSETTSPFANVNVVVPVVFGGKLVPKPLIWSRKPPAAPTQSCELPTDGGLSTAEAAGAPARTAAAMTPPRARRVLSRAGERVASMHPNVCPRPSQRQPLDAETPDPGS